MRIAIDYSVINPAYRPYLDNDDRTLIIYGGASSGKSYYVAQRYIYRSLRRAADKQPFALLVVRKVGRTNRDSTFALLTGIINQWGLSGKYRVNESDMRIQCPGGGLILFAGLDDVDKLKSITAPSSGITDIWAEEASEITKDDYTQLLIRQRGGDGKKQIVLTFNPIDINHWIKKDLIDTGKATVLKTTYRDNRHLTQEDIATLEGFKDTDPYYYTVYCLGEWGVYGKSVFDANKVALRLSGLRAPIKQGGYMVIMDHDRIARWQWVDDESYINMYVPPVEGVPYVIGADTAGEGSDYFTAQVLDNTTGAQVATMRMQGDEDLFARQLYCLGKDYNNALISIETNFSTYPIKEISRLGYRRQYIREREDTITGSATPSYGFKTTAITRPIILAMAIQVVRESPETLNDRDTLEEMLTFVRNDKGRAEAASGAHDDLVMAYAIALYSRSQQRYTVEYTPQQVKYNFEFERPKPDPLGRGEEVKVI